MTLTSVSSPDHLQTCHSCLQDTYDMTFIYIIKYYCPNVTVRTLYQAGKLENVIQEMGRLDVNTFGLCETRWTHSGMQIDDYKIIYSGGDKHEKGVGIILDKERSKSLMGYWAISDRVLLVKLKGHPFNISIIQAYAPTSASTEEDK